jgi:hypothetical protein
MSPNGRFIAALLAAVLINRKKDLVVRNLSHASDGEGLRLMQAFFHITDPDRRREVIALAEKLAMQSRRRALALPLPQDNEPST